MSCAIPVFEAKTNLPENVLLPRRRGVTVVTEHGRALTFGVSKGRSQSFLKSMAQGRSNELMAAMLERKAARLKKEEAQQRALPKR
jgi:hypothetical protein